MDLSPIENLFRTYLDPATYSSPGFLGLLVVVCLLILPIMLKIYIDHRRKKINWVRFFIGLGGGLLLVPVMILIVEFGAQFALPVWARLLTPPEAFFGCLSPSKPWRFCCTLLRFFCL